MKKKDFINNRDRILNDFFERQKNTYLGNVMDSLIVFEAISNGEATKVFCDKAIDAQFQLILHCLQRGEYRCNVVLS